MSSINYLKFILALILSIFLLNSCGGKFGADARKFPADPEERVKKNLEEGRGFRFNDIIDPKGGDFQFASSNELWRASLDTIDFIPLSSVNYSGGIIVTDWYSSEENPNESIKISIRFLSNEIRADALDIKIFNRNCLNNSLNCKVNQTDGVLVTELNKKILKTAAAYKEENKNKKKSN
ncbi:MAG: hypothetical protein CK535_02580 [Pelagibacteraceae bacterium]|nr:MAG: hypothetical protein CK535_02580 [Pelagibacteraceae bacterium]